MLALENPHLRSITLRRACDQWSVPGKMLRLKEAGTYEVIRDATGTPVALEVDQWRVGLFGAKIVRRCKCSLPVKSLRGSE